MAEKLNWLSDENRKLSQLVGEIVSPATVDDYNGLNKVRSGDLDTAEARILAAIAAAMIINES